MSGAGGAVAYALKESPFARALRRPAGGWRVTSSPACCSVCRCLWWAGRSEQGRYPLPYILDAHARSEYCHHGEEAVRDEPIAAEVVLRPHYAVPQYAAEEAVVVYQIDSQDVWADCHTEAGNAPGDIESAGGEKQEEAYRA